MYFRVKESSSGQTLELLESYRKREGHPRNHLVVSLGKAGQPRECQREIYQRLGMDTRGLPTTKIVVPYEPTL